MDLDEAWLPESVEEPTEEDIGKLPAKYRPHSGFFRELLDLPPTQLTKAHREFIRALGITGDPDRAYRRMAAREDYLIGRTPILLPMDWTYRHPPALKQTPSDELTAALVAEARRLLGIGSSDSITVLDSMAGGGVIPLEAVRYGFKVFANDLNPVASLVQGATLKYSAQFGVQLLPHLEKQVALIDEHVRTKLMPYFYTEPAEVWWLAEKDRVARELRASSIVDRAPADLDSSKNCILWCRTVTCPKCALNIPISTNFHLGACRTFVSHLVK